jgi:hypothetical protein
MLNELYTGLNTVVIQSQGNSFRGLIQLSIQYPQ